MIQSCQFHFRIYMSRKDSVSFNGAGRNNFCASNILIIVVAKHKKTIYISCVIFNNFIIITGIYIHILYNIFSANTIIINIKIESNY